MPVDTVLLCLKCQAEQALKVSRVCMCTSGLYDFLLSRHNLPVPLLHADMQSGLHGQDNISDKSLIVNLANLQANTVRKLKTSKRFHQYTPEQTNATQ